METGNTGSPSKLLRHKNPYSDANTKFLPDEQTRDRKFKDYYQELS